MERTDFIVTLVAVLISVIMAMLLKKTPTWHIVVLALVVYPVNMVLLSALESAGIINSPWSEYTFMGTVTLVSAVLAAPVVRKYKSRRDGRADRRHHDRHHAQDVDA
ncbi:hypothetical protein ACFYQA_24510 [Streptomyces sp. NPDC005774]|uniref:hypothetical protein n=1 Tax=Streptomyces sp. NPDC005774 TaxID=3364728 RepID=UPI0036AE2C4B